MTRFLLILSGALAAWAAEPGRVPTPRALPGIDGIRDGRSVPFGPDGKALATDSFDGTVRVWDIETSQPLRHEGPVTAVSDSPDGKTVATDSGDRTARLGDVGGK